MHFKKGQIDPARPIPLCLRQVSPIFRASGRPQAERTQKRD
jgi:hypothetical protein